MLGGLVSVCALALPGQAAALAGALDPSFGGDGRVLTNFTPGTDEALGVGVQPADGKIVAAGGAGGSFGVVRYNPGGGLDSSFGGDGKVRTEFTRGFDGAFDMTLQLADGKIVAVGRAGGRGGRFALARYNTNGTLDSTFGGDGKVITDFSRGDDLAFGVAIQADGKIVAAGRAGGGGGRFAVARYNSNGTLDTTFGGDGKVITNFTRSEDRADMVAIHADGKIVAAGCAAVGGGGRFALTRYNANGSLDTGFGGDGKVTTNFTRGFDGSFAIAVQPADQRLVVAGEANGAIGLARYLPSGALDTTFGVGGKVRTNFTSGLDYADDVELQGDGKIVLGGSANFFRRSAKFALARYGTNGTLDSSFSGDGKVLTDFTRGRDGAFNIALQPADGNIVAAGFAAGFGVRFALARYLAA